MDDTRQYKEMSKEAIEIQSIWIPHWGDFITDTLMDSISVLMSVNFKKPYGVVNGFDKNDIIWLPRQDQLQKMIEWQKIYIVREGRKYHHRSVGNILLSCDSMEQLWLAFVMKEKYNKIWNGSEWIKAERNI